MYLCIKPGFKESLIAVLSPFCIWLDISGEQIHAVLDTCAARSLIAEKKISNVSQTGMSVITLAIQSGMQIWRNPPSSDQ